MDLDKLSLPELKQMRRWHIAHRFDDDGTVYQRFIDELEAEIFARRARNFFWFSVAFFFICAWLFIGAAFDLLETPH
jgi:hypothetical protein